MKTKEQFLENIVYLIRFLNTKFVFDSIYKTLKVPFYDHKSKSKIKKEWLYFSSEFAMMGFEAYFDNKLSQEQLAEISTYVIGRLSLNGLRTNEAALLYRRVTPKNDYSLSDRFIMSSLDRFPTPLEHKDFAEYLRNIVFPVTQINFRRFDSDPNFNVISLNADIKQVLIDAHNYDNDHPVLNEWDTLFKGIK